MKKSQSLNLTSYTSKTTFKSDPSKNKTPNPCPKKQTVPKLTPITYWETYSLYNLLGIRIVLAEHYFFIFS